MKKSREIWLSTLCGMLIAGSFCGPVDVWAQLTGSEKLVPVVWNNDKIYFFQGSEYARYDIAQDMADSGNGSGNAYPRPIQNSWPGLFEENMDAAVFWPAPPPGGAENKTVAYFFKGNQFMRYDVDADRADAADGAGRAYPQPISLKWPGIWTDRVDAIVVWPVPRSGRTVAYFFRDDQYIRFDVNRHRADPGYPKPIAGNWPNFKFPGGIDGAVAWPTEIEGKSVVYFFKGKQYMRYDVNGDRADDQSGGGLGYPAPVAGNWAGLLITAPGGTDSLAAFAQECDQAIGVSVPDFDVDSPLGTTVQTDHLTPANATYPDGICDRPNVLNGKCDRGSRFRMLINTPDAYVVAHARKMGLSQGQYGDVAIIQHNKVNGKTCFYQGALEEGFHLSHDGKVKAPSKGVGNPAFWMTPLQIVNSKFPCVSCHDNGPIIRSPYLAQISGPNQLPGAGDVTFNSDPEPYSFVGTDFASWKAYKVEVSDNQCNGCHRMGVNNVSNTGIVGNNGTALDLGIKATALSQESKHSHSATSPIWMTPGQVTFDQGIADAALAIKQCAEQFSAGMPFLPNSPSCKITQFTTP